MVKTPLLMFDGIYLGLLHMSLLIYQQNFN